MSQPEHAAHGPGVFWSTCDGCMYEKLGFVPTGGIGLGARAEHAEHEPGAFVPSCDACWDDRANRKLWEHDGLPVTYPQLVLAAVCKRAGFAGLARCVPTWNPGLVEARLNEAAKRIDFKQHPADWSRVMNARDTARRIRKPINDAREFLTEAAWALIT